MARFAGVSQVVEAPIGAVLAIYAQENGQGMMFPVENAPPAPAQPTLAAVEDTETQAAPTTEPPAPKKGPHLRVVK